MLKKLFYVLILSALMLLVAPPVARQFAGSATMIGSTEANAAKRHKAKHRKRGRRGSDATAIVTAAARRHGVPVHFALRVARQETGVRCGLVGDRRHGGSYGPLQILNRTARTMFGVNASRLSCAAQADLGMRHLAAAYRMARGNLWLAAGKHNGGLGFKGRNRMASRYANAVTGGGKKARKHRKHRRR